MNNTPITDLEGFIDEANALAVQDQKRAALIATLKPIADRIAGAVSYADKCTVLNEQEAKNAAQYRDEMIQMASDAEKAIRSFDDNLLERMFKAHRRGTALIAAFAVLSDAAKRVKGRILSWQAAEEEKARKEAARLQQEIDAKARAERERAEKAAMKLRTPELREQRLEEAARIVAPVVNVAPPPKAVSGSKRWKVASVDKVRFIAAAVSNPQLQGFLEINENALARTKASNSMFEADGITFVQQLV